MPDISAIAAATSSLKSLFDLSKAMKGLRDASLIQSKVIELQGLILEAQQAVFSANQERATLIERVGQLESQVADLKARETEKQRYELTEAAPGFFAYQAKPSMRGGEAPHYVCANCFNQGKASILQHMRTPAGTEVVTCPGCQSRSVVNGWRRPTGR